VNGSLRLLPLMPTARVVLYARVSSKEQREEGYSIEVQLRLPPPGSS